jgi:predicted AAA+ superfamily ATPase
MYRRKIEETLRRWKEKDGRKPLVIKGCRQCGKTSSVVDFARRNYQYVVYLDFHEHKVYKTFFAGSLDVDTLTLTISAGIKGAKFVAGKTCLVLDEIQECPEARTSLKFFKEDGRFDVIATGSLLGVQGYGDENKKQRRRLKEQKEPGINSVPVGSEDIIEMYPLDFEEFLWANGLSEEVIEALRKCYHEEKPVPSGIHIAMKQFLNLYMVIGGLPEPINVFLKTNNMN